MVQNNVRIIGTYRNGNYWVQIYDDGTKIRFTHDDEFVAEYPESIDLKICNRCDKGCPQCHEESVPDGELADLNHPILNTLHPYTELAIGGGNPLEHPDLVDFLKRMKEQNVICNMTVNMAHLRDSQLIRELMYNKLIWGLGVSLNSVTDDDIEYLKILDKQYGNVVIHVIAGIVTNETLDTLIKNGFKVLILGYKTKGRGGEFWTKYHTEIDRKIKSLRDYISTICKSGVFRTLCFDNLALSHLKIKSLLTPDEWDRTFMGNDGQFTMYIDLVRERYGESSTMLTFPIPDGDVCVDDIFRLVQIMNEESGLKWKTVKSTI